MALIGNANAKISYLKTELSNTTKSDNRELAMIQTFVLGSLVPLTSQSWRLIVRKSPMTK